MPIRIIKAKHPLPPSLQLDWMDQLDMRCDALKRCIHIIMLEIKQQILPPVCLAGLRPFPPDRLFQRRPLVDRKPCLEQDKISRILPTFRPSLLS